MPSEPHLFGDYGPSDVARFEPERHGSTRSDFARDRARLVHSSAFRRLAAKTQVLSPVAGVDFVRNRLTHSLEVAQIGRELATTLGLDPDLVDTACLAHDLGHPPFGHNGEGALNDWARDIGGFEGNAQTLRVLTRLEPKVVAADGTSRGLNLTRASLDASCKYPWPAKTGVTDPAAHRTKFGHYADDEPIFAWLREQAPARRLCVEAQIMDLADDVAYSVHDFEDAVVGGMIDPQELSRDTPVLAAHIRTLRGGDASTDTLEAALTRLAVLDGWPRSWDGSHAARAQLKNLTSVLIGRFVRAATQATRAAFPVASLIRYDADVVVPAMIQAEITVMKGLVDAFVIAKTTRQPIYWEQRELLTELADRLTATAPADLDEPFAAWWRAAPDDFARRRVVIDQVASLTDQSASAWHARLVSRWTRSLNPIH